MAQYIELNSSNTIVNIIVADEDYINSQNHNSFMLTTDIDEDKRDKIIIGFVYDEANTRFVPRKYYDSWIFDEESYRWKPPIDMPTDDKNYSWDEDNISWKEVTETDVE